MLRLDYLSCFLTVVSTILVTRKMWGGLVLAGVNSAIICAIGFRTAQFGFIPANLFCIVVYALSLRSWRNPRRELTKEEADRAALRFVLGRAQADAFFASAPMPAPKPKRKSPLKIVYRSRVQIGLSTAAAAEPNQTTPRLVAVAKN